MALLDNGDGTDSHVITGSTYHWSDADLLLKADTVLKTYNPIFHSGGDITLQDRSFIDAEKHFTLGRNNLPSQLIITGTIDEGFATDSWKFYWEDIPDKKYLQYVKKHYDEKIVPIF